MQNLLVGVTALIALGIAAQLVAWRLRLPAILMLLVTGFMAGPVTGMVDPDVILGELLFPVVSLSVAIILFEGGLSLNVAELKEIGRVVRNLIVYQVVVTWAAVTALAYFLLDLDLAVSTLFGAILTVTGPTVIVPLLRQIRPEGRVGGAIKWEGIVNDPIGAVLAVLVFEALLAGGFERGVSVTVLGLFKTVFLGGAIGLAGAGVFVLVLRRYWIPDFLQNPTALTLVLAVFTTANVAQKEAGLLAVTVMGIALASQRLVSLRHVVEFKEILRVLLISVLFITLAARLPLRDPDYTSAGSLLFLAALILLVRPAVVALATRGSKFSWRERVFMGFMAPRGIVAAAVASLFAIDLASSHPDAARLAPLTFLVIAGTVTVYGMSAPVAARWLKLATPRPQGLLMVGASPWARALAQVLQQEQVEVVLADSNWGNVSAARRAGIRANYLDVLSEHAVDEMDLGGVGRVLALTSNDEVNALAALHFGEVFGRANVFQLPTIAEQKGGRRQGIPQHLRGRFLFSKDATYEALANQFQSGAIIKKNRLTDEFDFDDFRERYPDAISLVLIRSTDDVALFTATDPPSPKPGHLVISLVVPRE